MRSLRHLRVDRIFLRTAKRDVRTEWPTAKTNNQAPAIPSFRAEGGRAGPADRRTAVRGFSAGRSLRQIRQLQDQQTELLKRIYANLTPWQTVQVARHPKRPLLTDYLNLMFKDFRDCTATAASATTRPSSPASARSAAHKVMIVGQNKGRDDQGEDRLQLRLRQPRGLPQGPARR